MNYKRYNIFPICNLRLIFSLHFTFQFYTDKKQAQPCREGGLKQDWLDVAQCIRVQMKQESCREFWPGLKQSRVGWQMKWSKILKFWNVRSQISRPMCKGALFWTFFTRPTSKLSDSFIRILCQNSISDQLSCVRLNFSDKHYTSHNQYLHQTSVLLRFPKSSDHLSCVMRINWLCYVLSLGSIRLVRRSWDGEAQRCDSDMYFHLMFRSLRHW